MPKRTARDEGSDNRSKERRTRDAAELEAAEAAKRRREAAVGELQERLATLPTDDDEWEDEDSSDEGYEEPFDDEEEIIAEDDDDEEDDGDDENGDEDPEYSKLQGEAKAEKTPKKDAKSVKFADAAVTESMSKMNLEEQDRTNIWRRDLGDQLEDGQALTYSNRAYDTFFQLRTELPCLSFDIVRDHTGMGRMKYPLSAYLVCGSQAEHANKNKLYVLYVSNICRTKYDDDSDSEGSLIGSDGESSGEEEDDEAEEVNNGEPLVDYRTISHHGTANRVRCSPHVPTLVAVWSDSGSVQLFDIVEECKQMGPGSENWKRDQAMNWDKKKKANPLRFATGSGHHQTEGYGLDWSPVAPMVWASGDCAGGLFVWRPTEDGRWECFGTGNNDHHTSVEEIQWSTTQPDVLATCHAGGMVRIWDARDLRSAKVAWRADPTDINVGDWNVTKQASHLFVTGADSGAVSVWDLRRVRDADPKPLQGLNFHRGKITSVEFSQHNESVLSVVSDDGQCTLWDLSLERDPQEEQSVIGELFGRRDVSQLPDQLMFQHQGLTSPKEGHFHSQIPGMVVTTDFNGLHIFKPMNWKSLMK